MDGLVGEGGNDRLDGGAGHDHAVYVTAPGGVDVDLLSGEARGHGADQISDVEGVTGSGYDDEISGGHHGEELNGGLGDDDISGGHGDDTVRGGGGEDECGGETESSC
jgi:Ca2+-binding RTX toxin-like protein